MPSVEYGYSETFIETETVEYTDPETGETLTNTRERERVPIRLYTRKWTETDNGYRLWLRLTVTDLGDQLAGSGLPDNVTAPGWYADAAPEVNEFITGIYQGQLPDNVIVEAVQNAAVTVESMQSDGDDLLVDVVIEPKSIPVVAEFTGATVNFDPNRRAV